MQRFFHYFTTIAVLALALVSIGCRTSATPNEAGPPNENDKFFIRGTVTELTRYEPSNVTEPTEPIDPDELVSSDHPSPPVPNDHVLGHLFVEGDVEEDTQSDVASITVTKDTRFFRKTNGTESSATFADLSQGAYVEVKTSIVKESYPPQTDADIIVILD